ncbi:hypothetical protein [Chromobacterium violaceum]|uniref:hypothetical protein n=1 Tax=Chromobacterium violaceum TaxID=536 RepID=UPI003DA8DCDA
MKYQFATYGLIALALSACGGGGGGTASGEANTKADIKTDILNEADGLGSSGQAAGTANLGSAALPNYFQYQPAITVALSDQGQALAAWHVVAPSDQSDTASWAQASSDGKWSSAQPVPEARNIDNLYGMTLRMNTAGNAVLGWVNREQKAPSTEKSGYRATRYIQNKGWEAKVFDAGGGSSASTWGSMNTWDLALLDDNSFTASVILSGFGAYGSSAVLRTSLDGLNSVHFRADGQQAISYYPYAAFKPKSSDGFGLLYQLSNSLIKPGQIDINVRMASVNGSSFLAFPVATYPGLCYTSAHDGGLVAAGTPHTGGVLAALVAKELPNNVASCDTNSLQVSRISTRDSLRVDSIRLSAEDASVPIAPALAVDQSNNALIVWKETTGKAFYDATPSTTRLMWSQSINGGAWTTPASIDLSSLGKLSRDGHISLAMNVGGDAVVSLKLNDKNNNAVWNQVIALGRFNFASGWASWRAVANKHDMSDPQVAINSFGKAIVAYTALPTVRINGKVPDSYSGSPLPYAFAYLF